jgi:hypothetical protein
MYVTRLCAIAALCALAGSAAAVGYYDGETTLLCTAHRMAQCDASDGCVSVKPEDIGAANGQWLVDFKHKTLKPSNPKNDHTSKIITVQYLNGVLYAQSVDDPGNPELRGGAAWSLSVSDPDGAMTLAVAGNAVAFVGTGACVPTK